MKLLFFMFIPLIIFGQTFEEKADSAYSNAKKGVYWAFENVPEGKQRLDKDLILDDKLIASVKITREVEGVKVVSTGFFKTYEVELSIYKSYASLRKEGYLRE